MRGLDVRMDIRCTPGKPAELQGCVSRRGMPVARTIEGIKRMTLRWIHSRPMLSEGHGLEAGSGAY
jgi:hypothetical protein